VNAISEKSAILKLDRISKRFGGVIALEDVSFEVAEGECHAIVGENGAGKTTLINILNGAISPDSGSFEFRGETFDGLDPLTSMQRGLSVIHQELALVEPLSVMENIFIGDLSGKFRGFVKSQKVLRTETEHILESLGSDVNPGDLIENLSTSRKQIVEIAKALVTNPKLILMDEPTSSLTRGETRKLFETINILKKRGISIIFVSHRLNEVKEISDRITVIRDGHYIGTVYTDGTSVDQVIRMMVGREIELYEKLQHEESGKKVILEVRGLTKEPFFSNISFSARGGEILAFSGLVGAGRTELAESIFGFLHLDSGEIRIHGKPCTVKSPKDAMRHGIGLLPEDRKIAGIIDSMSVRENLSIAVLPKLSRLGFVKKSAEDKIVDKFVKLLEIKTANVEDAITNLSGGNQQKVMIARWMASEVAILMVDEPTQGVDVGVKAEIHKLLRELALRGVAVIVISSDLPEVLSIADRIIVMRNGKLIGEIDSGEATEENIMTMATIGTGS
jgi:ribose transport system ATP-binding protein